MSFKKTTLLLAHWGDGHVVEEQKLVPITFFTDQLGYLPEDIKAIQSLKFGETWTSNSPEVHSVKSLGEQISIVDTRNNLDKEVVLYFRRYYETNNLYISLYDLEAGDIWLDVTVNRLKLPLPDLIQMKDHTENGGVVDLIINNNIVTDDFDLANGIYHLHPDVLEVAIRTFELLQQDKSQLD